MLKEHTSFYPKQPYYEFFVPDKLVQGIKDAFSYNSPIVIDQISQDMVINPVKITQEDRNIHEYRDIYWWLLVNKTHPITRDSFALEVCQDPDDVLVHDQCKKQVIIELLSTLLVDNIHEKFVDIIMAQDGIDFLLFFSDTVGNLDVSVLQQSIIDGESTLTVAEYLQRSENGRELYHAVMSSLEQGLTISSLSLFESDVDDNPSQSTYPT